MAKRPIDSVEEPLYFPSIRAAREEKRVIERKIERNRMAMVVAIVQMICLVSSFFFNSRSEKIAMTLISLSIILSFVAYIAGGGILEALASAWTICKWGWFLCPIFPVDLAVAYVAFVVAVFLFFFVPIVFVWVRKNGLVEEYSRIKKYISDQEYSTYNEISDEDIRSIGIL